MSSATAKLHVAIACGGTGGHLFPGLAVAGELARRGCDLTLLISQKEIDQQIMPARAAAQVISLPAVGLERGGVASFLRGLSAALRTCRRAFLADPPDAVLAMGGFTSAAPVVMGRILGAATFLHESNTIPGRANRWLAPWVDEAFVGFASAARRLSVQQPWVSGTPVRPGFVPGDTASCRRQLGLVPDRPVVLVTGGSQGARGLNEAFLQLWPRLAGDHPQWQVLHLAGAQDFEMVRARYGPDAGTRVVVQAFEPRMELALNAATIVLSRAGGSSLAELAAMRRPAILIPFPAAADNHQWHNACELVDRGAALLWEQGDPLEELHRTIVSLLEQPQRCAALAGAIGAWHQPGAAQIIAERMLARLALRDEPVARRAGVSGERRADFRAAIASMPIAP